MARRMHSISWRNYRSKSQKIGSRKESFRGTRQLALLACEGSTTEPQYFRDMFAWFIKRKALSPHSFVIAKHGHTDPVGVLDDLLKYKGPFNETYRDFSLLWIVIDRDEERCNGGGHTLSNFNNALSSAAAKGIKVAWSNPCFEIWFLLHFQYRQTPVERDKLLEILPDIIGCKYEKNTPGMFEHLLPYISTAKKNAEKLSQLKRSPADANPGTTVYELIDDFEKIKPSNAS